MTWCRSAIPDRFSKIGRSRNRITWDAGGSGLISKSHSGVPCKSSTMRPCRPSEATKAGRCSSWASEPGLGSSMIVDGIIDPMELGHLPYKGTTYEDHVGIQGLKRLGKKKWRKRVADVVSRLVAAFEPDDIVLGGGNVRKLKELPPGCRAGNNANAFRGGFALWNRDDERHSTRAERTAASFDAGQGSDDRPRIS
jgi:hypothetical protein